MDARRHTIQRHLIFNAMRELDRHATAEQVYEHVAKEHPTLGKATVYRNLNQMAAAGELLNIGSFLGATHYDHNVFPHHHFVCEKCGKVFDVLKEFPGIDAPLEGMEGFVVRSRTLTFSGVCPGCNVGG